MLIFEPPGPARHTCDMVDENTNLNIIVKRGGWGGFGGWGGLGVWGEESQVS